MKRQSVIFGAAFYLAAMMAGAGAGLAAPVSKEAYREMAHDLIAGIDASWRPETGSEKFDEALLYLKKAYNYIKEKRVRIAIWPFDPDTVPVALEAAEDFNDALYARLLKKTAGRYDFVARDELKALINDMDQTGALENSAKNPLAALMESARKIDILIRGRIRVRGGKTMLSYKAVSVDGRVIAATTPRVVHLGVVERNNITLDRAVRAAARELTNGAHEMTEIRLGGIRFQDTGSQPPFGRRFLDLVSAEIAKESNNALSGRSLKIKTLKALATRGVSVTGKELSDSQVGAKPGSYLLSGAYWDLGKEIEIRVSLKSADGATIPWKGRINRQDIGGTQIRPKTDLGDLREGDGGPVSFHLKSDRGNDPAYKIGEDMNLLIRLGRDAWVYCFYRQANGEVIQILPNPHFWKNLSEPKLAGKVVHKVPGQEIFPFAFKMTEPIGEELVKCFATSRDVTADLPQQLRGRSLSPLPKDEEFRLSEIFRNLRNTTVSEASMAVTVTR